MATNVENGIIAGITGYDIHFAYDANVELTQDRKKDLSTLKEYVVNQIILATNEIGLCFIRDVDQYDKPAGPWPGAMFEIEIGTVKKDASEENATDFELIKKVDAVMRRVVALTKEKVEANGYPGTLIVHPNCGSKNTNYAFERKGLYELSWRVTGPSISFIDIWDAPGGLSKARQKIDSMRAEQASDDSIAKELRTWVLPNGSEYSDRLIGKLLKEPSS